MKFYTKKYKFSEYIFLFSVIILVVLLGTYFSFNNYFMNFQEGVTNKCEIVGNPMYNSNCKNGAKKVSNCTSGCGTRIPKLGNVCCTHHCCNKK